MQSGNHLGHKYYSLNGGHGRDSLDGARHDAGAVGKN